MNSVWIECGPTGFPFDLWGAKPKRLRKGNRVNEYVPASEYNRLRKAVEWALGFLHGNALTGTCSLLAQKAGLRWNGKRWVEVVK